MFSSPILAYLVNKLTSEIIVVSICNDSLHGGSDDQIVLSHLCTKLLWVEVFLWPRRGRLFYDPAHIHSRNVKPLLFVPPVKLEILSKIFFWKYLYFLASVPLRCLVVPPILSIGSQNLVKLTFIITNYSLEIIRVHSKVKLRKLELNLLHSYLTVSSISSDVSSHTKLVTNVPTSTSSLDGTCRHSFVYFVLNTQQQ